MSTHRLTIEDKIQSLLEETRTEAERYSSAHYRRPTEGKTGLALRLEAIEEALLELAKALDRNARTLERK